MISGANFYVQPLRAELVLRARAWARGRAHVESYGGESIVVFSPEEDRHGNFFDASYAAILARPAWRRRMEKVHTGNRSLPSPLEPGRRWRELDSSMSSDALLMSIFCAPGVVESDPVRRLLGVTGDEAPEFGWKARVPLKNGRFDRTEVDMCWGELLVEAKLTEADFQTGNVEAMKAYRDFESVFAPEELPTVEVRSARRRAPGEFAEEFTQEWEEPGDEAAARAYRAGLVEKAWRERPAQRGFAGYQLIRNVLAAHAIGSSFCVVHDARRPDLREAWYSVMAAVRESELRTRLKVLTWQELATALPEPLQSFLGTKYGIAEPGMEVEMTEKEMEEEKSVIVRPEGFGPQAC